MSWQKLASREVYQNRYLTVTEDRVLTDHGDEVTYGIIHKEPAVLIIPWDGARTTLIGQYRYAVDYFSWEWPAGHYEHDSLEQAVRAELEEEAGLLAGKLEEIGNFHIAPGHLTQVCHTFLATDLKEGKRQLETSEKGMKLKKLTLSEMKEMIRAGEIKDGLTITSLALLELYLTR
jgi:8-oxo-dGTP pyrophosphatase MutT (NUDIX family)